MSRAFELAFELLLKDHYELSSLCETTDVAGIAVENDGRLELMTARITAGSTDRAAPPDTLHAIGPWRVFRYRRAQTYFADAIHSLVEFDLLRVSSETTFHCAEALQAVHRNTFVEKQSVFSNYTALTTWVGATCGARTFADLADYLRFWQSVAVCEHYYDVQDVIHRNVLRQSLGTDEARGLWFEIEPAFYLRGVEWRSRDAVLHFQVPEAAGLADARVKWQTASSSGVSSIERSGDSCSALIRADGQTLNATVIYRNSDLWKLHQQEYPESLADSAHPDFPDSFKESPGVNPQLKGARMQPDPQEVFVVYGRDAAMSNFFFNLLRNLGLKPLEFSQLIARSKSTSPYIADVVRIGFEHAKACVVLFTGDDLVQLRPDLGADSLEPQPRPNVLLEAGMAIAMQRDRTIIIEVPPLRGLTDLGGIHAVRFTSGGPGERNDLASRLESAGCKIDRTGRDWLELPFPQSPRGR